LLLLEEAQNAIATAEGYFMEAADLARRQGALSWELRSATSLARLRYGENRTAEAHAALAPIYAKFTEGLETADVKAAGALLAVLAPAAKRTTGRHPT